MGLEDSRYLLVPVKFADRLHALRDFGGMMGVVAEEYESVRLYLEVETAVYAAETGHPLSDFLIGDPVQVCKRHGCHAVLYVDADRYTEPDIVDAGSLYSDLAKIYEKAVQFPSGGSITISAVTTLSDGDITHAVPDNTGYITEGQLFLRRDSDIGKVIVDPFRSLSRLKQLVTGKKTRKDHPQVMNAAVRLYADAANAKTKMENGFDLTNYDERALAFAKDYANQLLAIDVNLNTTEMLDVTWGLFSKYFKPEEVNIKKEFVDQYWKK